MPGVAFAAAGEENEAELQVISDIQEKESHEMSVHEMAVQTAEMDQLPEISGTEKIADVEAVGNTERADVIDTQEELEAAIAQGGEIDLTGQRIELTRRLSIANDVVIRGGTLVGTEQRDRESCDIDGKQYYAGSCNDSDVGRQQISAPCLWNKTYSQRAVY